MTRRIKGLKWARELEQRPRAIPQGRARGLKALGTRYEKALAQALPEALNGRWFEFEDLNGHGYCQVDFILRGASGRLALLECKHTWVEEAWQQLEGLYVPVVEAAREVAVVRVVQVCKNVTEAARRAGPIHADLESALAGRLSRSTLQWLPNTSIRRPCLAHDVVNRRLAG